MHIAEGISRKVVKEGRFVCEVSFLHVSFVESTVIDLLLKHFIHLVDHVVREGVPLVYPFLWRMVLVLLIEASRKVLIQVR